MSTSVDRSSATVGLVVPALSGLNAVADVPGMLAERIGDLYATEERRRRLQRTERMIRKAESLK